ncbi:MAG: reprolysin-like metallopeptidase [Aquaticitalea sp.]
MNTKLHYVFTLTMVFLAFSASGQKNKFVKISNEISFDQSALTSNDVKAFESYEINEERLRTELQSAPLRENLSGRSQFVMEFPTADGKMETFRIMESSVFHPDLQAQYPEIRQYVGHSQTGKNTIFFSISPYNGLNAIMLGSGTNTVYESYKDNVNKIKVFDKGSKMNFSAFECETIDSLHDAVDTNGHSNRDADDSLLRTYRLAMSVTGEYSALNGGTLPSVNAAIATTMTNVNAVFQNDFNVRMQIIPTNNNVVYLTGASDPYSGTTDNNYNSVLASTLDAQIGSANYDIGHLMAGIGNNGNAGCIGCVCINGSVANGNHKGSGYTTSTVPNGINFDIDFVAHEMGHQYGGRHTFTFQSEGAGVAQMEPGSGSTIMGYAGITSQDVQSNSDPYFHAITIQQIVTYVKNTGTCSVNTNTGNTTPVVNAGSDLTLPIGTAFKLIGTGSDADGDIVTYCWEQFNENNGNGGGLPSATATNSNLPLFRSFLPTTNPVRTFPELSSLLSTGVNGGTWEKVPTVTRTADFRLTIRDNRAGGASNTHDDMRVTFTNTAGPLAVTSQTSGALWTSGTNEMITWDVNNTTSLAGSANVNILLSTDGGLTYPTVLVANTPNDGSQQITVPSMPAPYCRIMIEPTGNQYFAINSASFPIDYEISTTCETFTNDTALSIPDNGTAYTASTIMSTSGATIGGTVSVKASVDITHTYLGDLYLALQSPAPASTFIQLVQGACGSADDMDVTFVDGAGGFVCASPTVGDVAPLQPLSAVDGQSAAGQWLLGVADTAAQDTGTLNSWSIEFCTTTETPLSVQENELVGFSLFPNPNNGEFTLNLKSNSNQDIQVQVYDIRGRIVFNNSYANTQTFSQPINLNSVQSGMYLVKVSDGDKQTTKKIVVE